MALNNISHEVITQILMKHIPSFVHYLIAEKRKNKVKNTQVKWYESQSIDLDRLSYQIYKVWFNW